MQWNSPNPQSPYSSIEGIDPAADWLLQLALDELQPDGPEAPFPFLMRIDDKDAIDFLNARPDGAQDFLVSRFEPGPQMRTLRVGEYFTVFASRAFFDRLADPDGGLERLRRAKKQIQISLPMARTAYAMRWRPGEPEPELAPPPFTPHSTPWPPGTVVVGIIDDAIGFAHQRFRTAAETQTRVEFFWRQDGAPTSPSVLYGREWGRADIDALIAANPTDDEAIYRQAGMLDFTRSEHKSIGLRAAHGTHVLDTFAGADPASAPLDRPVIAVQLPVAATAYAFGAGLEAYARDAIKYIRVRARLLAGSGPPLPVVINFSYAVHHGPHDATAMLEAAIDEAIAADHPPLRVVLPAGNSHAVRCHAEVRFGGDPVALPWRVQPDDRTSSAMQIWMPYAGPAPPLTARVRLTIETPDGLVSPPLGENDGWWMPLMNGTEVVCYARYDFVGFPTERGVFSLWLRPTARLLSASPGVAALRIAPHGVWTVRLGESAPDKQRSCSGLDRPRRPHLRLSAPRPAVHLRRRLLPALRSAGTRDRGGWTAALRGVAQWHDQRDRLGIALAGRGRLRTRGASARTLLGRRADHADPGRYTGCRPAQARCGVGERRHPGPCRRDRRWVAQWIPPSDERDQHRGAPARPLGSEPAGCGSRRRSPRRPGGGNGAGPGATAEPQSRRMGANRADCPLAPAGRPGSAVLALTQGGACAPICPATGESLERHAVWRMTVSRRLVARTWSIYWIIAVAR